MSNYREELETFGIPPDAIEAVVDAKLQALGMALHAANQLQRSPHAPTIQRLLTDPEQAARFTQMANVDAAGAIEWIELKARHASPSAPSSGRTPQPVLPGGAGLMPIPGMEYGPSEWGGRRPTVEEARQRYERAPTRENAAIYAKSRLDQVITDEHLNQ